MALNSSMQSIILTFYFGNHYVDVAERVETYTFFDFLAISGGLLGLFLGISVLSIVELIYYFTLHLFWTIRYWKSENAAVVLNHRHINVIPIEDLSE